MRGSPVGFAYDDLTTVLAKAAESAEITHDHPEGVKGAQATAAAIYLARSGSSKAAIRRCIEDASGYDLSTPLDVLRPTHSFDESCQRTVPPAIRAFLESSDWEDAVRNAVSLGSDSDTLACITGGIAEAAYAEAAAVEQAVMTQLDDVLGAVVAAFRTR